MCAKVTCTKCQKPTWAGCGQHIEEALENVPVEERCQCPGLFARIKSALGF
ncbi:hypothetical protein BDB01DRAFT_850031 [Pilobolus umbonatus]|nr:hypothetical protein BDB01DRAFT_850031 [Pilobolus umbonatus]